MRRLCRIRLPVCGCLALLAVPAAAQEVNMDLMAKWSAVTVVRYVVVGEFAATVPVLGGQTMETGRVTDRVELTFDWNQNEFSLVGTASFKNFPSALSVTANQGCPAARINGPYDQLDVTSVTPQSNVLQVVGKRSYPRGAVPSPAEPGSPCGAAWTDHAATTETAQMMLIVPPTIYFAMPSAGIVGLTISRDSKSMILVQEENPGWTWTYTPTPVR